MTGELARSIRVSQIDAILGKPRIHFPGKIILGLPTA